MANVVITQAVQGAKVLANLADETKDTSKVEQPSIAVRYVGMKSACIYECFLTYMPTENLTAEAISECN